ncbi:DeoR family transcriptional regulator [Arenibacter latericius]|uniref:DeoR family transcriptional regulator n=1 Tax=Arenibacter latericius TaxID=86104 RepID=UPI0004074D13|nr:DeoR family transcriptional regulator [Arenibacter latericius]
MISLFYFKKRHQTILDRLIPEKHVEVLGLCRVLGASAVSIRKGLKFLVEKGFYLKPTEVPV